MKPHALLEPQTDPRVRWSPVDEWESPWGLEDCTVGRVFDACVGQPLMDFDELEPVTASTALTGAVLQFEPLEKRPASRQAKPATTPRSAPQAAPETPSSKTAEPLKVVPRAAKAVAPGAKAEVFSPQPGAPQNTGKEVPRTASSPAKAQPGGSSRVSFEEVPLPQMPSQKRSRAAAEEQTPAATWGLVFSMGLGICGFVLLVWIYGHEMAPESDEDLRLGLPVDQTPVVKAPVKLLAFLNAVPEVKEPDLRKLPPWEWDTPALSAHVQAGGTALDNLRDLLEDEDWHPLHSAWAAVDHSGHDGWARAGVLLQAQAAYLMRRGNEPEAFTSALDQAELSRRVLELWCWPGYVPRAQALCHTAAATLAVLLRDARLDEPTLAAFQEQYARCRPETELMRQFCAAFYEYQRRTLLGEKSGAALDMLPGGVLRPNYGGMFFKVNETLALFARSCREARDAVARPAYSARVSALVPQAGGKPLFYHPNSGGMSWYQQRAEALLELPKRHHLSQARHGLVLTLFALRRYALEQRMAPASLAALAPRWLENEVMDPFSGASFKLDLPNGVLSSAGLDYQSGAVEPSLLPLGDDDEPAIQTGLRLARVPSN